MHDIEKSMQQCGVHPCWRQDVVLPALRSVWENALPSTAAVELFSRQQWPAHAGRALTFAAVHSWCTQPPSCKQAGLPFMQPLLHSHILLQVQPMPCQQRAPIIHLQLLHAASAGQEPLCELGLILHKLLDLPFDCLQILDYELLVLGQLGLLPRTCCL
jgi:hypothetical protein